MKNKALKTGKTLHPAAILLTALLCLCLLLSQAAAFSPAACLLPGLMAVLLFYALAAAGRAAGRDALSGLLNHQAVMSRIGAYLKGPGRRRRHALLLLDIDDFKALNDRQGHPLGDQVITRLGRIIGSLYGRQAIAGRLGGDEFILLLKNTGSLREAGRAADMLCAAIAREKTAEFTVSIGLCLTVGGAVPVQELYLLADEALYRAKAAGKNCWNAANGKMGF